MKKLLITITVLSFVFALFFWSCKNQLSQPESINTNHSTSANLKTAVQLEKEIQLDKNFIKLAASIYELKELRFEKKIKRKVGLTDIKFNEKLNSINANNSTQVELNKVFEETFENSNLMKVAFDDVIKNGNTFKRNSDLFKNTLLKDDEKANLISKLLVDEFKKISVIKGKSLRPKIPNPDCLGTCSNNFASSMNGCNEGFAWGVASSFFTASLTSGGSLVLGIGLSYVGFLICEHATFTAWNTCDDACRKYYGY